MSSFFNQKSDKQALQGSTPNSMSLEYLPLRERLISFYVVQDSEKYCTLPLE